MIVAIIMKFSFTHTLSLFVTVCVFV